MCDYTGKLSIPEIFILCMDIASAHAQSMGIGYYALKEKNLFWMVIRTKVEILRRPSLAEEIEVSTWPELPSGMKCDRYYGITSDGEELVRGMTEWGVFSMDSMRLVRTEGLIPPEFIEPHEKPCSSGFSRISRDFSSCPEIGTYKIMSVDVDLEHHMNNTSYVRALMSMFSSEEAASMDIKSMEVHYRAQCLEGEELRFLERPVQGGKEYGAFCGDRLSLMARIEY
jgi:medium-chain acyl-[acyl-carrier-protein] hydrolase